MKEPRMPLGKIVSVDLRSVWPNEQRDFTPWVKENISHISEIIGADIEDIENESDVGTYSADLVGKITGSGGIVVIENQYGETDHDHLGKLLTYSSGKNAKFGIWIAEEFRDEHVATLEYLNRIIKPDGPAFFGIKIALKKIGDSSPAPEFNVVIKPNEYQREISQEILSEADKRRYQLRLEFFSRLADRYRELNPSWNKVKAQPNHWLSFGAGKSGFAFSWVFRSTNGYRFVLELYIDQNDKEENKKILKELEGKRAEIEKELGYKLDFQELPDARACRIEYGVPTEVAFTKLSDKKKEELIEWGAEKMKIFSKVMTKYVRELD